MYVPPVVVGFILGIAFTIVGLVGLVKVWGSHH